MRTLKFIVWLLPLLLAAACGGSGGGGSISSGEPLIKVSVRDSSAFGATLSVRSFDAEEIYYAVGHEALDATSLLRTGRTVRPEGLNNVETLISLNGLEQQTLYTVSLMGVHSEGGQSAVSVVRFHTTRGTEESFAWEKRREGPPAFADVSLVTRGQHNSVAPIWTEDRFTSHISYVDENGAEHWLFEALLCTEGFDSARGRTLVINPNGQYSGAKDSWEDLISYWLSPSGTLRTLDAAIARVAARIGDPPAPRYVIIGVPDPIMLECFANPQSATDYWGEIDGKRLDFARVEDQLQAYLWFMDECRRRFDELKPRYLELAGFYIISEELPLAASFYNQLGKSASTAETWNAHLKRWETLIPEAASYLHSCNEGLYWVPYFLASGYRVWRDLGIDMSWMQPNHYWDTAEQHPMSQAIQAMKDYKMGIELEFEYSLVREIMADGRWAPDGAGHMTFQYKDIPALEARFREYMSAYREAGLYGQRPIALYSGTDAMNQLRQSSDPDDRRVYLELCHFIEDSPLRKR